MPRPRFGITAGVNSSTISGKDVPSASRRTGLVFGVNNIAPITPNVAIQSELLYSMKGATDKETGINATLKLNYIEIPVMLRFDVPASGGTKPFFYVGPAISFKVSCDLTVESNLGSSSSSCDNDSPSSDGAKVKATDFSGVVGAGLAFDVQGRTFTIGARYTHGFTNIPDNSDGENDVKNRTISILASFEFPWKR